MGDAALAAPSASFVGRTHELERIRACVQAAANGAGRVVLIAGDAGIGKTAVARQLLALAGQAGAFAAFARCFDGEATPPYWPWMQALRAHTQHVGIDSLRNRLGSRARLLAPVLPEMATAAAPAPGDAESARFRLFDTITETLRTATQAQPLVFVLDDVHWADSGSWRLLHFIAREIEGARLLIAATYRDAEIVRDDPRHRWLAALQRESICEHLSLAGLSAEEVAQLVGSLLPAAAITDAQAAHLVDRLVTHTGGNPLFIRETLHALAPAAQQTTQSLQLPIPDTVSEVITQRLRRLSETTRQVLPIAAVVGQEFTVQVVRQVAALSSADVLIALDEAERARLIEPIAGEISRFHFVHPLFRESVYHALTRSQRARLHLAVGEVIEAAYRADSDRHLSELAAHFFAGALAGAADKAIAYGVRAGDRSIALHAEEEAAVHYRRVLEVLDVSRPQALPERCAVTLALGRAEYWAGDTQRARARFLHAAELARTLDDAESLARAALGYGGVWGVTGLVEEQTVRLLEEALAALPDTDTTLRVELLGRLSTELYWSDQRERRETLAREGVQRARRLGDAYTIARALNAAHFGLWGPENSEERLAIATENVQLAERLGDRALASGGRVWRIIDLLELGRIGELDVDIQAYVDAAEELRQPHYRWQAGVLRAMRATLDGRHTEAERLAEDTLAIGTRSENPDAMQFYSVQILVLRWQQGRLDELAEPVRFMAAQFPAIPAWRAALALIYVESDREAEARPEFEILARDDFRLIPRDANLLVSATLLAQVCVRLGDRSRADILSALLEPYAGRVVVVGNAAGCFGAIAHYLGALAATCNRPDAACRYFEDALQQHAAMGARPCLALTQYEYARHLLTTRDPAARARATELLEHARRAASELGMRRLATRVADACRSAEDGVPATPHPPPVAGPRISAIFRRKGDYWQLVYAGDTCELKDSRGLLCIAHLLRHPGRDFLATDLMALGGHDHIEADAQRGDAGAHLDRAAHTAYRERLVELRAELAEAESFNDLGRIDKCKEEIELLTDELARGLGLGRRHRKAADHAERARINVTRVIKRAIQHIAHSLPALARYLDATIKTGTYCTYTPDPDRPITWQL
jgi:hypothetical protein